MTRIDTRFAAICTFAILLGVSATSCARKQSDDTSFDSPDAAAAAMVAALERNDIAGLQRLLGPDSEDLLVSGDPVQDGSDRADFVAEYGRAHKLVAQGDETMTLVIGESEWPFPVPLIKREGHWAFDGEKGADELVYRRIGANEIGAIAVCRGFVEAQREYASEGRDGDAAGTYALKLVSDEGMHNGLYWPKGKGEIPSPAGPFVAAASEEGYRQGVRSAYHGYYYRLLFKQGDSANGGAREYFKDGLMTDGFALVAWPAQYEVSGVMTFIVNQDGVVFQKDFGEGTDAAVAGIVAFDPGSDWTAVTEPAS